MADPFADPGKTLARFSPSIGLSRKVACHAAGCAGAEIRTLPPTRLLCKNLASHSAAITPSYSSPCTPPRIATVGPGFVEVIVYTCGKSVCMC